MHIPDGFLDGRTAVTAGILAAAGVGVALHQVRRQLAPRRVPLLGMTAAFVFTAQMLNFPVAGGTSGHLMGGVLAAVLLGPVPAVVVMTTVVLVQGFVFADGGVTALGANIFNMAVLCPVAGYAVYAGLRSAFHGPRGQILAAAFAAWCATVLASVSCAALLGWSGVAPWPRVLPVMAGLHLLIGLGEGAITALVLAGVARARPELLLENDEPAPRPAVGALALGAIVALGLALFVAPFACPWPDGLERAAERLGFEHLAAAANAPLPDYRWPGLGDQPWSTSLAGLVGTVVAFLGAWLLARALVPKSPAPPG